MNDRVKGIKDAAKTIRKSMTGEHYYDKAYGDLRVADVLLVLEDMNWHTEETILEALAQADYTAVLVACSIAIEHDKQGCLTPELQTKRDMLDEHLRKGVIDK